MSSLSLPLHSASRLHRRCLGSFAAAALTLFAGQSSNAMAYRHADGDEAKADADGKVLAPPALAQPLPGQRYTLPSDAGTLAVMERKYSQHLNFLASPFLEGRAPGTKGNRIAADYIEHQFRSLGLMPAFHELTPEQIKENLPATEGSPKIFRQPFVAPPSGRPGDSVLIDTQMVSIGKADFTPGQDFAVLGYSGSKDVSAPLAFVGYSITNGESDYTSYPEDAKGEEPDLTGKIAIIFRFEPMDEKGQSKWETGGGWSPKAGIDGKLRAARKHNAAGIILVNPPGADDPRANKMEGVWMGLSGEPWEIPVVMMSIDAADKLVHAADTQGRSLLDLRTLADEKGGVIDLDKATTRINVATRRISLMADNVGAVLPGVGDLAGEYVVVGGHYDHIGYGYFGSRDDAPRDKVHPGADDNASGTSGVLLIADWIKGEVKNLPEGTPRRSILFMAFSAEESGLVGSRFYAQNPIVPIEKHAMMLNLDMIGRLREDKLEMSGLATAVDLDAWCKPFIDASGFKVSTKKFGAPNSDHASFTSAGVPAMFLFTGLHQEYHSPQDTIDTINTVGATRVADFAARLVLDFALRQETIVPAQNANLAAGDHGQGMGAGAGAGAGQGDQPQTSFRARVRFGIMPGDYSNEEKGILVGGTTPGLPAEKAGLKKDDRLTKWNGEEIETIEQWMEMLQKHSPGDKVKVTYTRAGKEETVEVELVASNATRQ